MQLRGRLSSRFLILAAVVVLLVAAHTLPLYYLFSHRMLSAGAVALVLGVILAKHLGAFGPLSRLVRGISRKTEK